MITLRPSAERGSVDRGWLKALYSFSFNTYYDPKHMGFGPLRVINEDRFGPGRGFGTHPHDNMEIITYVLSGGVAHQDSTGAGGVLKAGDIQRMSAGRGVQHSEFNASESEWLHLLQIWIEPNALEAAPRYDERHFPEEAKRGKLCAIVSGDGRDGSLPIYQDAALYATILAPGESVTHPLAAGRRAYVHVVHGAVTVNGKALAGGDAAKLEGEREVTLSGDGEALLFDLP